MEPGALGTVWPSGTSCTGAAGWKAGSWNTTGPTGTRSTCAPRPPPPSGRNGTGCWHCWTAAHRKEGGRTLARTLQFEQESLPAETGAAGPGTGAALQALADGLNAAAAGGARARGVLQSLPAHGAGGRPAAADRAEPALAPWERWCAAPPTAPTGWPPCWGGQTAPAAKTAARAVEQVGRAAKTTARSADKAARSLAGFDEIERLAAADAADTALPDAGGTGGGSGGAGPGRPGGSAAPGGLPGALAAALGAVQAFWQQVQALYAPAIEAWRAAWAQLQAAAPGGVGPGAGCGPGAVAERPGPAGRLPGRHLPARGVEQPVPGVRAHPGRGGGHRRHPAGHPFHHPGGAGQRCGEQRPGPAAGPGAADVAGGRWVPSRPPGPPTASRSWPARRRRCRTSAPSS